MTLVRTFISIEMPENIIREANKRGMILPTRVNKEKAGKFEGAYVYSEKKGLFKNVFSIDFASLYPNIMIQFKEEISF